MSKPTLLWDAHKVLTHGDHKIPEGLTAIEYICNVFRNKMLEPANRFQGISDRIYVVVAKTASGKSTTMPVALFRLLKPRDSKVDYRGRGILVTVPRISVAIGVSRDQIASSDWSGMEFGVDIGYQTGAFTQKPAYNNLLFSTIGVLRAQLDNNDDQFIINKYQFIIIDESHLRNAETDITLMKLKSIYLRNKDNSKLPFLILTSATIDANKYANYFNVGSENIINVEGSSFPKTVIYNETDVDDLWQATIDKIIFVHKKHHESKTGENDILVFVTSTKPYRQKGIKELIESKVDDLLVTFIDRDEINSFSDDYQYVAGLKTIPEKYKRMVIFGTNAIEVGMTIDSLSIVIEGALSNNNECYAPHGIIGLVTRPIAKSNAQQRFGRVGRKFPGFIYPLYTEKSYNMLQEQEYPEIVSLGCDSIILDIIKEQQKNKSHMKKKPEFLIEHIDMLDMPPMDSLILSLDKCLAFGYVSYTAKLNTGKATGYGITDLGKIVSKILRDLTLETARVVMSGYKFELASEDSILLACVCHRDFNKFNKGLKKNNILQYCLPDFISSVEEFRKIVSCDFIELLIIYSTILYHIESDSIKEFANKVGLSDFDILKIVWKYNAISKSLLSVGINTNLNTERKLILADSILDFMELVTQFKTCLYSGFMFNTLRLVERDARYSYQTRHGISVRVQLPPYFINERPKVLITDVIQLMGNTFKPEIMYDIKAGNLSVVDGYTADIIDNLFYTQCRS